MPSFRFTHPRSRATSNENPGADSADGPAGDPGTPSSGNGGGDGGAPGEANGGSPDAAPAVPGNGAWAGADGGDAAARIDLVRGVDGLTPPDPGGLLRPISPARAPGSRRQRHEEARAARAAEPAAANGTAPLASADDGSAEEDSPVHGSGAADGVPPATGDDGPDPLDWAELKLPPVQSEHDDPSPYEGLPAEPIVYADDAEAGDGGDAAAPEAEVAGEDDGMLSHPIPVVLEEEPEPDLAAPDEWEADASSPAPSELELPPDEAAVLDGFDPAGPPPEWIGDGQVPVAEAPPAAEFVPEMAAISPAPPDPSPFGPKPIATPAADVDRTVTSAPPQPPAAFALPDSALPAAAPAIEDEITTEPAPPDPDAGLAAAPADAPPPPAVVPPAPTQPPGAPPSAIPPAVSPPVHPPTFAQSSPPPPPPAAFTPPTEAAAAPPPPPAEFAPPNEATAALPPPPAAFAPPAEAVAPPPPPAGAVTPPSEPTALPPPPAAFAQPPAESAPPAPAFAPPAEDLAPPPPPPAAFAPPAEMATAPPPPPPAAFAPPEAAAPPPPPPPAFDPPPPAYDAPIAPPPAYEPVAFDPSPPPPPPGYEPSPPLAPIAEPDLYGDDELDADRGEDLPPYGYEADDDRGGVDLDQDLADYRLPATDDVGPEADDELLVGYEDDANDDDPAGYDDELPVDYDANDDDLAGYDDEADDEFAPSAATMELRQIAGLTAGIDLELDRAGHEFAEGDQSVAFTITVDDKDRAVLVPGTMAVKLDTQPVTQPTLIGWGALDVGSARFIVRPRRSFPRADEWLAQRDAFDRPELEIEVPPTLGVQVAPPVEQDRTRRRFGRRRAGEADPPAETLNAESWEFIDRIRAARADLADRERYLHPDPAELVVRTRSRAPILGIRPPGHPLFAKVGVIVADMPWMPNFDDIRAIPDTLGPYLQPLMSLPSIPIAADLLVGPLGIVGSRAAAAACARHIILSLHALSTPNLRVHIAASPERAPVWDWAYDLAVDDEIDLEHGFPVVVVDGTENFGRYGLSHADAVDHRVGVVILTDSIDDLPNYCGTVLQVDRSGSALLTNHLGHVIAGTPVGVANDFARHLADDLNTLYRQRR